MTVHQTTREVTYIGKEELFEDRNYGSSLQFVPGQTRTVPAALAARFLQHIDCFEEAGKKPAADKPAAKSKADKEDQEDQEDKEDDDTAKQLALKKKEEDERRLKEDKTFELHTQIDSMTKADIVDFVKQNYKETLDMKMSKADMVAQAKSLVDQFGVA